MNLSRTGNQPPVNITGTRTSQEEIIFYFEYIAKSSKRELDIDMRSLQVYKIFFKCQEEKIIFQQVP